MSDIKKVSLLDLGDANSSKHSYYVEDEESGQIGTKLFSAAEEILLRFANPVVLLFENGLTEPGNTRVYAHEGKLITPELFNAMLFEWRKYRASGGAGFITSIPELDKFMRYASSGPAAFMYVNRDEAEAFIARHGNKPTYMASRGTLYTRIIGDKSVLYGAMDKDEGLPLEHYLKITAGATMRFHTNFYEELMVGLPDFVSYVDITVNSDYSLAITVVDERGQVDKSFDMKTKSASKMLTHLDAFEKIAELYK